MTGLLLRLAGPLQSWGERSAFARDRDTAGLPTRSGIIGMFAAAEGIPRDDPHALAHYETLQLTVRVDRPGVRLVDYHTVGGGQPKERTAATSTGGNKGAAVITNRHYMADAVFVIAVTGPDQRIARIADALHQPHWSPYLGRRACVPDEPFLLRASVNDPVEELLRHVPLSPDPARPAATDGTMPVMFLWEQPPDAQPDPDVFAFLHDTPRSFAQHGRSHSKRHIYRTVEQLPAALAAPDHERTLHQHLVDYALNIPTSKEVPS
ncbi:type I-E CRISPR-associated protein Cas5/CasD [Streptomyces cavernae]|uniref:type I-E CRISPR-associated protein Cas5/CasD n=1 Tax=Streptomyces cavernae TaxID=2259034 RepID=UPI000FEB60EF|nr:type I-E CRISPR-associated protein Cas5/CasD [Streptomyces cavernae]